MRLGLIGAVPIVRVIVTFFAVACSIAIHLHLMTHFHVSFLLDLSLAHSGFLPTLLLGSSLLLSNSFSFSFFLSLQLSLSLHLLLQLSLSLSLKLTLITLQQSNNLLCTHGTIIRSDTVTGCLL